jgi:MoaA/NifB/PqqE/SkfB family radical SAM enzyme
MSCPHSVPVNDKAYAEWLSAKIISDRLPAMGGIDLTKRCNLRCRHCYHGPEKPTSADRLRELSREQISSIVDQTAGAGCLFLLLTGGEPLIRTDFAEIYRHIKHRGILTTVFTNATLVNEETARLFAELPPYSIEVSLYGASAETYEKVTGVEGSFGRCMRGIRLLLDHGVKNVSLKTMIMTINCHEFDAMLCLAQELGLKFRADAVITPRYNGDMAPLELRVAAEDAVDMEFRIEKLLTDMKKFHERFVPAENGDSLYVCGAGINGFHIDPYGMLMPCSLPTGIGYDLLKGDFAAGWETIMNIITSMKADAGFECTRCDKRLLCGHCNAYAMLEGAGKSEYRCAVGMKRYDVITAPQKH